MQEQPNKDGGFMATYSLLDSRDTDALWYGTYLCFEGKDFLTCTFIHADVLHLTICLIGSDMDASKYKVRMQFTQSVDAKFVPFEMTVPVIPIRKTYDEISEQCLHVIFTKAMVQSFCRIEEMPGKIQKMDWSVGYKIMGITDSETSFTQSRVIHKSIIE